MPRALRPLTEHDGPILLRWRNLPDVSRYMNTDHVISRTEHEAWLERSMKRDDASYWVITSDGTDVGFASVTEIDRHQRTCSWALYLADPRARGRGTGGFTTYTILEHVFGDLKLRKASCEVLASNANALALYERFGFVREGLFREQILKAEGPVGLHRLGILSREWEQVRDGHRHRLLDKGILTG